MQQGIFIPTAMNFRIDDNNDGDVARLLVTILATSAHCCYVTSRFNFARYTSALKSWQKSRILFKDANTSASAFHNLAKSVLVSNNLINNLQIG